MSTPLQHVYVQHWQCNAREVRLVLRLPQGFSFEAIQVQCRSLQIEYTSAAEPEKVLTDTIELLVPVREEDAAYTLRRCEGEQTVTLWLPREQATGRSYAALAAMARRSA